MILLLLQLLLSIDSFKLIFIFVILLLLLLLFTFTLTFALFVLFINVLKEEVTFKGLLLLFSLLLSFDMSNPLKWIFSNFNLTLPNLIISPILISVSLFLGEIFHVLDNWFLFWINWFKSLLKKGLLTLKLFFIFVISLNIIKLLFKFSIDFDCKDWIESIISILSSFEIKYVFSFDVSNENLFFFKSSASKSNKSSVSFFQLLVWIIKELKYNNNYK